MTPAPPRPALPLADAVMACVRMRMSWQTVALAYKLSMLEVEAIVRAAAVGAKRRRLR